MKVWLCIILFLLSTKVFASAADSGRCPWKMPFTIKIAAIGITTGSGSSETSRSGGTADFPATLDTNYFEFTIDTSYSSHIQRRIFNTKYSIYSDTLHYSFSYSDTNKNQNDTTHSVNLVVAFVPGKDSIFSISLSQIARYSRLTSADWIDSTTVQFDFQIASLRFDDTLIYCSHLGTTSNLKCNLITNDFGYARSNSMYHYSYSWFFTGSNIFLSGLFYPCSIIRDSSLRRLPWPYSLQFNILGKGKKTQPWSDTAASCSLSFSCHPCFVDSNQLHYYSSTSSYADWISPVANEDKSESFSINFIPGTDSIALISYLSKVSESDWDHSTLNPQKKLVYDITQAFNISSLKYDSSGLFTSDSSFCSHSISISVTEAHSLGSGTYYTYFSATSADLSGIFQPKHYACDASVIEPKTDKTSLLVTGSQEGLRCSFSPSDHVRTIAVYSILGIEVANNAIAPEATETTLTKLTSGFYFVRLDNDIAKVIIQ